MSTKPKGGQIPNAVIATVSDVIGTHYFSHSRLETLFTEAGAPGEAPPGNCVDKCSRWLKAANEDSKVDAFEVLGKVVEFFMDHDISPGFEAWHKGRERIMTALAKHGLSYHAGGRVFGGTSGPPTRSLNDILKAHDLPAVQVEFDRALKSVEADPAAALTAACSLVESLLKIYIEDEDLDLPSSETIKPLWSVVSKHLGLDPASVEDEDIKRILGGLSSVVDGVGCFRTHAGSAHGRGRRVYQPTGRHARLAIHAAHTLATFVLETWASRNPQQ
jgi:hypothetical protein